MTLLTSNINGNNLLTNSTGAVYFIHVSGGDFYAIQYVSDTFSIVQTSVPNYEVITVTDSNGMAYVDSVQITITENKTLKSFGIAVDGVVVTGVSELE